MQIKVLNVDVNDAGSGRNKYQIAEVLYDDGGDKKTFKIFSFVNPTVFKTMSGAKNGDVFTITTGKNDKGYTTWESATSGASAEAPAAATKSTGNTFGGRDFESKEEREIKQRYIIRQSSLSNAIAVLTTGAKSPPDEKAILDLSDKFVNYVFETADIFSEDFPQDIPH